VAVLDLMFAPRACIGHLADQQRADATKVLPEQATILERLRYKLDRIIVNFALASDSHNWNRQYCLALDIKLCFSYQTLAPRATSPIDQDGKFVCTVQKLHTETGCWWRETVLVACFVHQVNVFVRDHRVILDLS
jgi:hypothetical protein